MEAELVVPNLNVFVAQPFCQGADKILLVLTGMTDERVVEHDPEPSCAGSDAPSRAASCRWRVRTKQPPGGRSPGAGSFISCRADGDSQRSRPITGHSSQTSSRGRPQRPLWSPPTGDTILA